MKKETRELLVIVAPVLIAIAASYGFIKIQIDEVGNKVYDLAQKQSGMVIDLQTQIGQLQSRIGKAEGALGISATGNAGSAAPAIIHETPDSMQLPPESQR